MTTTTSKLGEKTMRKPLIDSPDILERIKGAKERLRDGHALMRIPVDPTDPDCVLADAELEIERLRTLLSASQPAAIDGQEAVATGDQAIVDAMQSWSNEWNVFLIQDAWMALEATIKRCIAAAPASPASATIKENLRVGAGVEDAQDERGAFNWLRDICIETLGILGEPDCVPEELPVVARRIVARAASTSANVAQGAEALAGDSDWRDIDSIIRMLAYTDAANRQRAARLLAKMRVALKAPPAQPSLADDARAVAQPDAPAEPIPMLLFCPRCGAQHIDRPESHSEADASIGLQIKEVVTWTNPPHRSHLCHACKTVWRPADVPTTGVASIETKGKADTWIAAAKPVSAAAAQGQTEDARDAARYRWLRSHAHTDDFIIFSYNDGVSAFALRGSEADRHVDAALTAAQSASGNPESL